MQGWVTLPSFPHKEAEREGSSRKADSNVVKKSLAWEKSRSKLVQGHRHNFGGEAESVFDTCADSKEGDVLCARPGVGLAQLPSEFSTRHWGLFR